MTEQIELIRMELIDRPVKIAREVIDPERVRELAESIREVGLLEPVLIRPVNGRFEMVAGDRRFLAHKLLNLKEIKAIVKALDDRETVIVRGVENLQRVNLTPSEEARTYVDLRDEGGLSIKNIAKRTGKTENTVSRYLKFAAMPEEVRRAVDGKHVSLKVAEILMDIEDEDAFKYHFGMAAANGVSASVAQMWVDDHQKTKAGLYYGDDQNPPPPTVESAPKPVFMTCEICLGPCEIHKVRNLVVCPDCRKKVKTV